MGPWYFTEGAAENILDREYAVDGKTVIAITDFFTSVNKTNPGPYVHCPAPTYVNMALTTRLCTGTSATGRGKTSSCSASTSTRTPCR